MRSRAIYGDARGEVAVVEIGIRLAKLGHYLVDLELLGVLGLGVRRCRIVINSRRPTQAQF